MGPAMEPHVRSLLDAMFSSGLSLTLVEALDQISIRYFSKSMHLQTSHSFVLSLKGFVLCIIFLSIPTLLPTIQDRLLECISTILSRSHQSRSSVTSSRGHIANATQQVPELSGSALVQLALQTLARFNFKVCPLVSMCMIFNFLKFFLYIIFNIFFYLIMSSFILGP